MNVPVPDPLRQLGQLPNVSLHLGDLLLEVVAVVGHLDLLQAEIVTAGGVSIDHGHHAHDVLGPGVVEELGAEVSDEVLESQNAAVSRLVYVQLQLSGGRLCSGGLSLLLSDLDFDLLSETIGPIYSFQEGAEV